MPKDFNATIQTSTRFSCLFGVEPDARVWGFAMPAQNPSAFPILDIGAGRGRNALPLARHRFGVDVIEGTTKFAEMQTEALRDKLNLRICKNDSFDDIQGLRRDYQLVILSDIASYFRTSEQLHKVFTPAAQSLATGGRFVMNTFLAKEGYTPDLSARESGQQCYSAIFTRNERSCLECGGNSLAAISEDWDLDLIRRRGQG